MKKIANRLIRASHQRCFDTLSCRKAKPSRRGGFHSDSWFAAGEAIVSLMFGSGRGMEQKDLSAILKEKGTRIITDGPRIAKIVGNGRFVFSGPCEPGVIIPSHPL